MIKVLLLDDEKLALEYLENVISWDMYRFEIVGSVNDAEQALKIFRKERPELVISDVMLPGMNGLEFVSRIREIDQSAHILFLSGYKYFEYVKEALRLGTDDYLLKSDIDEETFLKKVLQIREQIEREQKKKRYTANNIYKDLFQQKSEESEYRNILAESEYIALHKKYYYTIVRQRDLPEFFEESIFGTENEDYFDDTFCNQVISEKSEDTPFRVVASFTISKTDLLTVYEMTGDYVSLTEVGQEFYRFIERIFDAFSQHRNMYHLFYCTRPYAIRQFGRVYHDRRSQMDQSYVKKKGHIVEFDCDRAEFSNTQVRGDVTSEQILEALKSGNEDRMNDYLKSLEITVVQEDFISYLWYLKEITGALKRYENYQHTEISYSPGQSFMLSEAARQYDLRDPYEVIRFLDYKFSAICKLAGEYSGDKMLSSAISNAVAYIQQHYSEEELCANSVAEEVSLSTSWLSTKFKEEMGMGLVDYINKIRIENAKNLFENGNYMIYEVSERVGFASSQYFSKIFKQNTGYTPNEYKRMVR